MVSTRGVKLKFFEGERVLCYEPDPTKAKVLYDSKVLDVIVNKDHRGRKNVEYLIHFQGWNSSWDRCVGEEYVLKDTAENRQLQKDLAEKAQLQLGAYLYRRERKKHSRKINEPIAHSSEDGSSGSPARMDTDEGPGSSSSSEEDSSIDEDTIPIELTKYLREMLEHDYFLINTSQKLLVLPAEPNVITILETYWRHYVTSQMCELNEKPNTRYRQPYTQTQQKNKPEDLQKNLNICKEVLDGLRIYFDFTLNDLLLYKPEQGQVATRQAIFNSCKSMKQEASRVKTELEDLEYAHLPNIDTDEETLNHHEDITNQKPTTRRRGLRSDRSIDSNSNGNSHPEVNNIKAGSSISSTSDVTGPMAKALAWKLIPDQVYLQKPPPPSLVYGAVHLLRLLVKLPELLNASSIIDSKLKVLLRHLDSFIEFLNEHKEWYGDKFYNDIKTIPNV